jgi:GT2 family glycosyltransferase
LAHADYVVCQDADLEYDPRDILRLLACAESTQASAVFGSRLAGRPNRSLDPFQLGRVALTKLFRVLYRSRITDVATCYKLMRTDVVRDLDTRATGFDLDFEIPARLRRRGHTIEDVPISYRPRDHAHGKKIRWRDGVSAAWTLLKLRLL